MTLAALSPARPRAEGRASASLLDRPWAVVLLGLLLSAALSWPRAVETFGNNTFFDTDDAMRLVEVRDWMGGQGWFDLTAHRLGPPPGLLMHWSRVVDVPVAALIRLFGLLADRDTSERLARIAFPLLMQLALLAATVGFARLLAGAQAVLPAMALAVLSGFAFGQFPPGRIDHHAPQIVLLVAMSGATLSALSPGRGWHAGLAALALALSVSISLENLPFAAVIVVVLPLAWLARGAPMRPALGWFASGLAISAPLLFAATVPPARYGAAVCDAYSVAHLAALGTGAAGLAILAVLTPRLPGRPGRGTALALAGAAAGGVLLLGFPACLHDPYAAMDPVLKRLWLANVAEAQPLFSAGRPGLGTPIVLGMPLLIGALGLLAATCVERGLPRWRWGAVLALVLVGLGGTLWQVRVAASTAPLALLGGVWLVTTLMRRAEGRPLGTAAALLAALPFTTLAWAFVPLGEGERDAGAASAGAGACRTAAALAPLAALPPGLVFAPIDDGSHLLVSTPHAVLAAPYHRNERGNREVLDGFLAAPGEAEAVVRASGARYVALCPGEAEVSRLAGLGPDGLGARLARGEVPGWLDPVPLAASPIRVFKLRPAAAGDPSR